MGYQRPAYKLMWPEGHELHGLEIRTRGMSFADLQLISGYREMEQAPQAEQLEAVAPLLDLFAAKLISWNYEDENGNPVGTSRDDLAKLDIAAILPIIMTWQSEVSTIRAPLPQPSSDGAPSLEASIPMEIESLSPESLNSLS